MGRRSGPRQVRAAEGRSSRLGGRLMLADIFTGEVEAAEIAFLVALILGVIAAFLAWPERKLTSTLGWLAVAAIALGCCCCDGRAPVLLMSRRPHGRGRGRPSWSWPSSSAAAGGQRWSCRPARGHRRSPTPPKTSCHRSAVCWRGRSPRTSADRSPTCGTVATARGRRAGGHTAPSRRQTLNRNGGRERSQRCAGSSSYPARPRACTPHRPGMAALVPGGSADRHRMG